jgi:hypothetical protein
MRWSPGPRSRNLEDRRFEWQSPEDLLLAMQDAVRRGTIIEGGDIGELPPWMTPGPPTQEALVGAPSPDYLAFLRAFNVNR